MSARPAIAMSAIAEKPKALSPEGVAARAAGIARIFSIKHLHQYLASKKLERIVQRTRDSYECRRYRERRAAALKGLGR